LGISCVDERLEASQEEFSYIELFNSVHFFAYLQAAGLTAQGTITK
jgi:hypothetical protein